MLAKPLFIVADDLTGAADCAARCFGYGYSANVFLAPRIGSCHSDVCSFTTDSRSLAPIEAGQRTREILRTVYAPDVLWYKKIDSTLRGNIGSEIDAFLEVLGFDIALVCPAFPLQNRGLLDGSLLFNHQKMEVLHLPTILASQSKYASSHIPLDLLEKELPVLVQHIMKAYNQGTKIFSLDATDQSHLLKIVDAYRELPYNTVLSGSAGLVSAFVSDDALELPAGSQTGNIPAASERIFIIVGSGSDTAHRQIASLRGQRDIRIISIEDTREDLNFPTIVLHMPPPAKGFPLDGAESRKTLDQFVLAALEIMEVQAPDLLIITGGDTSTKLLTKLGIERLEIEAELFPGIPLTSGKGANGQSYRVILKPGSFGDESIFGKLLKIFRNVGGVSHS